jgi:hypothetical protein
MSLIGVAIERLTIFGLPIRRSPTLQRSSRVTRRVFDSLSPTRFVALLVSNRFERANNN